MRTNYLGHLRRAFAAPQGEYMTPADVKYPMAGKTHASKTHAGIVIPTGRGARHKARRLALANRGVHVHVKDKRGTCHYSANALYTGTIWASTYYWQRGNAVHHVIVRRHPSAGDITRVEGIKEIRDMLDNDALACPACRNHACLPNWPEIDRCKVEHAHDIAAC